jgi:hypothetical protein
MYDSLWEDHPKVKQIRADSELRSLRRVFMRFVKISFPELEMLAQERALQIQNPAILDLLIEKVYTAPNQDAVRWLLEEKNV